MYILGLYFYDLIRKSEKFNSTICHKDKPDKWHSQDLDFENANIQHHFHLDDNYFTSQFQRRRWRSYQNGEWEDDGVKIVKLIGQGSFDTLIGEKARKSIVKYMLGILGSISKHCKQACSLE